MAAVGTGSYWFMNQIKRVAIVGGTHGNELTGIYLVKKFEREPNLIARSTFETIALLANPKAFEIGRRYVETDLNRCFLRQDLENPQLSSYEEIRAKEIYRRLTGKGHPQTNLIIDLHSSTANMGLTVIPSSNHPFNLQLAAYLIGGHPSVKVYRWMQEDRDSRFLRSISELGCSIEVGPIAQGVLDPSLFQQTEALIMAILDYVETCNLGIALPTKDTLTIYQCLQKIDYPRNESGEIQAMIHPQLQLRDYQPLHPGDPMFLTFDYRQIIYEGKSTLHPVFINEAAYYEKDIAMCLTQPQKCIIPPSAKFIDGDWKTKTSL
jgi:Succinylglutamate desuccinylase